MKFIYINKDQFQLLLNNYYLKDIKWDDRKNLTIVLKEIFNNLEKIYHLNINGLYKVEIYISRKLGAYFNIEKLNDLPFSYHDTELKLIIYQDYPLYLKYTDSTFLPNVKKAYFYKGSFYIDSKELTLTQINYALEMGEIYLDENLDLKDKAKQIRLSSKLLKNN